MLKRALEGIEARTMFVLQLLDRGQGPLDLTEVATEGLKLNLASIMDEITISTKLPRTAA